MARVTTDRTKSAGRSTNGRPAATIKPRPTKARVGTKAAFGTSAASKEELRARVEKLERANATLRIKNKELRLVAVEAAEQVDALTLQLASSERRANRQARHEAPAEAVATREIVRPGRGRRKVRAAETEAEAEEVHDAGSEAHVAWNETGHAEV